MNKYNITFSHRGKNYTARNRKAASEQEAKNSIIEQCRIADIARKDIQPPVFA